MTRKKVAPTKKNKKQLIKRKRGAPTKYDKDTHPLMAWVLAILGKTNKEIAAGLTISTRTLHKWGKKNPEFVSSLKGGKAIANARVVKALYTRAIGCKIPETKVIQNSDGTVRKEVIEREVLPDVAAIKLWLTNRDPNNWKEVKVLEGAGGEPLVPKQTIMAILGTKGFRRADAAVRAKLAKETAAPEAKKCPPQP